jgi:DNA-binding response OmpR family regulator
MSKTFYQRDTMGTYLYSSVTTIEKDGHRLVVNPDVETQRSLEKKTAPTVLLAYPYSELRCIAASALRRDGFKVHVVNDGTNVLDWLAEAIIGNSDLVKPNLIIADISLPGRKGIDLLADLRYAGWTTPFILLAKAGESRLVSEAQKLGKVAVFESPFDLDDFRTAVSVLTA